MFEISSSEAATKKEKKEPWLSSSTMLSIKFEHGCLIPDYPNISKKSAIRFHVSKILFHMMEPMLIIHPVEYWIQFKEMEKNLQVYGRQLPRLNHVFEQRGSFLVAAIETTDEEGNKKFNFYRGWHTGQISIPGGTHKIILLDYSRSHWIEVGNMMPLLPEHCHLPVMSAKCKPLSKSNRQYDRLRLTELQDQHCEGYVEKFDHSTGFFPVITVKNIKEIPQPQISKYRTLNP